MIEEAKLSEKVRRAARAGASVRSPPRQNDITPRLTTTDFSLPRRNMVRSLTTMIALPQPRRKKFRRENYVTVSFWRTDAKILSCPKIYIPHRWTTNIIKDCMRYTNVSWRRGYTWRKFDWDIIIRQTRRKKLVATLTSIGLLRVRLNKPLRNRFANVSASRRLQHLRSVDWPLVSEEIFCSELRGGNICYLRTLKKGITHISFIPWSDFKFKVRECIFQEALRLRAGK